MLSIVIPVYNSEEYIKKTLDSLINQSWPSFEVLIVDDGSTDHSLDICEGYALRDARFKVFHQDNKGVSAARNLGVSKAENEIITFIDSDDYVSEHYCETILREMNDVDLLVFQAERHYPDNSREIQISTPGVYNGREVVEEGFCYLHNFRGNQFGFPWNKAFHKSIITDELIEFPVGVSWKEDEVFMLRYGRNVNSMRIIDDVLYHYQIRGDSQTFLCSTPEQMDKAADLLDAELDGYSSKSFLWEFYNALFTIYFLAAKEESCRSLIGKRLAKVKTFYHRHPGDLPGMGKVGKLLFNTPTCIGSLLLPRFGDWI